MRLPRYDGGKLVVTEFDHRRCRTSTRPTAAWRHRRAQFETSKPPDARMPKSSRIGSRRPGLVVLRLFWPYSWIRGVAMNTGIFVWLFFRCLRWAAWIYFFGFAFYFLLDRAPHLTEFGHLLHEERASFS